MKIKLLLLTLILASQSLLAETKKSDDWTQYSRYEKANAELTTSPDVVFMGNSITDNWAKIRPEFFANNNFVGRGISGQTSVKMLARFRSDVVNLNPKAVVILAGTNDIAQNNGPISTQHTAENIYSMCDVALQNDITPIICSVMPCVQFGWRKHIEPSELIVELNEILKAYAKRNKIAYIDYHAEMSNAQGGLDPELSADGCHPTAYGYFVMEGIVTEGIKKALKLKKPLFTYPEAPVE